MGRVRIYCFHENGVQPVNITWLKDGKTVPREAVLTIHNQALTILHIDIGDQGSYKCILRSKFSTLRHVTRTFVVFPKRCKDIRRNGTRKSGKYSIYPLSKSPVQVYCDMKSMNSKGITVISHDSEVKTLVKGFEESGSYRKRITYNIPMQIIEAIIAESNTCEQFIKYECYDSRIFSGNTPYAWWISSTKQNMTNWGGVDHTKTGCSCSLRNTCYTKNKKCNCDTNDNVWREDSGILSEKEYLPINEVRFGDKGSSIEKGYHTVGNSNAIKYKFQTFLTLSFYIIFYSTLSLLELLQ